MEASAYHGRGMGALAAAFDAQGMYADGMNLYQYLGSNPWTRSDPLGLESDPFDIVDDYLAEWSGNAAATLTALGQDAKAVAVVAASIASYLPFPLVGNLGDLALYALGEQTGAETAVAIGMGLVPGGKLLGKAGRGLARIGGFLSRVGRSAFTTATRYAKKFGGGFLGGAARLQLGLLDRALKFIKRKPPSLCHCFAAGTMVWTSLGQIPIEQIQPGDMVYTMDEQSGQLSLQTVVATIPTQYTAILELTLLHESGQDEVIRTADEHPFWVDGSGWRDAAALIPGDILRTQDGLAFVRSLCFTNQRSTVYDLMVDQNHNYLIGVDGTWVHNCVPLGKVVPFREARNATKGFAGDIQAHHLIERRHFKWKTLRGNPNDFPAVVLTEGEHLKITNKLRAKLPYGTRHELAEIRAAYRAIYPSDWWQAIEPYLR